jgi:hypothetical protein
LVNGLLIRTEIAQRASDCDLTRLFYRRSLQVSLRKEVYENVSSGQFFCRPAVWALRLTPGRHHQTIRALGRALLPSNRYAYAQAIEPATQSPVNPESDQEGMQTELSPRPSAQPRA